MADLELGGLTIGLLCGFILGFVAFGILIH